MKEKTMRFPAMILLCGLVLSIIVSTAFSIVKRPTVTEYTFPISITYELGGETFTIEDEFRCSFDADDFKSTSYDRFYTGELAGRDDLPCGDYLIESYADGNLIILTNLFAGSQMGDPQYDKHYTEYYRCEPAVAYYVTEDYREYYEEEYLAPYDVRIVDWSYPAPIENSFKFSHIAPLKGMHVLPLLAVSLLTLLACMILVKRDRSRPLGVLDKISVVCNFLVAILAIPFLTIVCMLSEALGSVDFLSEQIFYCIPALTGFGLAASVCLRRRGYKLWGLLVQFVGIVVVETLVLLVEIL